MPKSSLATILFPEPITTFVIPKQEDFIVVSGKSGRLYKSIAVQNGVNSAGFEDAPQQFHQKSPVTCMILIENDSQLVTSNNQGCIFIWDIISMQLIKTLEIHKSSNIYYSRSNQSII